MGDLKLITRDKDAIWLSSGDRKGHSGLVSKFQGTGHKRKESSTPPLMQIPF